MMPMISDWIKNWLLIGLSLHWFGAAVMKKPDKQAWAWSLLFVVLWPLPAAMGIIKGCQEGWRKRP